MQAVQEVQEITTGANGATAEAAATTIEIAASQDAPDAITYNFADMDEDELWQRGAKVRKTLKRLTARHETARARAQEKIEDRASRDLKKAQDKLAEAEASIVELRDTIARLEAEIADAEAAAEAPEIADQIADAEAELQAIRHAIAELD